MKILEKLNNSITNTTPTLADAIMLSAICHNGQTDKGGNAYILHPLRVLHKVMNVTDDVITHFLAIFHDLIEDCSDIITIDDLIKLNYPMELINELLLLTKYKSDDYLKTYIPRICLSYRCTLVKKIDIEHNTKIQRMHNWEEITLKDIKRLEKYYTAYQILSKQLDYFQNNMNTSIVKSNNLGIKRLDELSEIAVNKYIELYDSSNYLKFLEISGVDAGDIIILNKYIVDNKFPTKISDIVKNENFTNHCVSIINEHKEDDNTILTYKGWY